MELLNQCDIVVDVGGVYDYDLHCLSYSFTFRKRFDHHQKGFFETFDANHKTKLSSAGLVFATLFPLTVVSNTLERTSSPSYRRDHFLTKNSPSSTPACTTTSWRKLTAWTTELMLRRARRITL